MRGREGRDGERGNARGASAALHLSRERAKTQETRETTRGRLKTGLPIPECGDKLLGG